VIGGAGLPTGVFCLMAVGDYDFDMASTIFVGALTVAAVVASLSTMALMWLLVWTLWRIAGSFNDGEKADVQLEPFRKHSRRAYSSEATDSSGSDHAY